MQRKLKVLVVGATGGSGLAAVQRLAAEGHQVTALSRSASSASFPPGVIAIDGDATHLADMDEAVRGQDAVVVTLGISENPFRVRFGPAGRTPRDVRSTGTRNVISAMRKHSVRRLVVQTTYGVGETRNLLRFSDRLFFNLILKPQIDDTELQELEVRGSGLDWVLAQPVQLTDAEPAEMPFLSARGEARSMKVARSSVARFLTLATCGSDYLGKSIAVSN